MILHFRNFIFDLLKNKQPKVTGTSLYPHQFLMEPSTATASWYSAYPAPRSGAPNKITREEVLEALEGAESSGIRDFVLIDVRRNDYEGGSIHGSINIPAQSFYTTIPSWYSLFKAAGIKKAIWYCGKCYIRHVYQYT
ncbi:hypothetical protein TWF751_007061 [Orbilia oligospora]|nr:hypothetical protein TWF751_007061 [Orbilia oligospora]